MHLFNGTWRVFGTGRVPLHGHRRWAHPLLVVLTWLMLACVPSPADAQSASFRAVDTNSDGVLSRNELIAAFGRAGSNRLLQTTDHNNDGRITIFELRRGPNDRRADPEDEDDRDDDDDDNGDDDGDDGDDGGDGGDGDGGDD